MLSLTQQRRVLGSMRTNYIAISLGDNWAQTADYVVYDREISSYGIKDIPWLMRQEAILRSPEGRLMFGQRTEWMVVFVTSQIDMLVRLGQFASRLQ